MFVLSSTMCDPIVDKLTTHDLLTTCSQNIETTPDAIKITVDGINVNVSRRGSPIQTDFFNVTYPQKGNFYTTESGTTEGIASGYFIFLHDLPGKTYCNNIC